MSPYSWEYPDMAMRAASGGRAPAEEDPSLFASDDRVLSDSAIRRILEFRLRLGDSNRVAVLQLAERPLFSRRWSWPTEVSRETVDPLLDGLRESRRVTSATLLPSLLVPRKRTVGYLREAAARYQADLLVVYRSDCRTYERTRVLASSEFKATCTVESVLIETRTGIVPFTTAVKDEVVARKRSGDSDVSEAVQRNQLEAIGQALSTTGRRMAAFLDRGAVPPP